ncbi:hypothetical protein CXB51_020487 [Gossypium anomalum]|uniref:FHA domain-containing protein n=1 Tax=Gossypium anomalum TaxID=47600 RepID=A0A8J5YUM0_9ROSI|nr:hypothetical protein CXB51_020487 [Gossypium anomalum]
METYSIMLGRNSKKSIVDVDLASLGGGMNISRHHARIFYDFARHRFALEVLGKTHGGTKTGRSVGSVGSSAAAAKKGRGREYCEDYGEGEDVGSGGKKVRREEWNSSVEAGVGGKAALAGVLVAGIAESCNLRHSKCIARCSLELPLFVLWNIQYGYHVVYELEEKDVVTSMATVLSDLCGPGEWMTMEKLHAELVEQFGNIWHHSQVRRYLTLEDWPGPESKGKPWYGLPMLLRKYPEHFVINWLVV